MAKLLLAEDEEAYRTVLPIYFTKGGHETRTAETGELAIEIGREYGPDLLIADWMLEGLSGLDVAESLQSSDPDLRIIFITGFQCEELKAKAGERGLRHVRCVEKPFEIEDIIRAVEDHLK